jgi:hypothetical protein
MVYPTHLAAVSDAAEPAWRGLPSSDRPDLGSRLRVVGDPRKSPAQLDSSPQLTLLIGDSADCVGVGHEEYLQKRG